MINMWDARFSRYDVSCYLFRWEETLYPTDGNPVSGLGKERREKENRIFKKAEGKYEK